MLRSEHTQDPSESPQRGTDEEVPELHASPFQKDLLYFNSPKQVGLDPAQDFTAGWTAPDCLLDFSKSQMPFPKSKPLLTHSKFPRA